MTTICALLAVICITLLFLYISFFFKKLSSVSIKMEEISSGESDLTARISINGQGELTELSSRFNKLMEKLQSMIRTEKQTVNSLTSNSEELKEQTQQTLTLIDTASTSINEIYAQAKSQNDLTSVANGTIEDFIESVIKLDEKAQIAVEKSEDNVKLADSVNQMVNLYKTE